jgi:hypothetical protein
MELCPAAITAGAIFTALIVKDIYQKNYKDIIFHSVGGIFSVVGLAALCQYVGDIAGWILLLIPFFVLIVGFYIQWVEGTPSPKPVAQEEGNDCCSLCSQCPCRCNRSWPTDCDGVPLPAPSPIVTSIKEVTTPTPPSKPVDLSTNTFGCPKKA